MHEHEARLERLQSDAIEAPRKGRKLRLPSAGLVGGGPSRSGEIVIRGDDLVVGYLPPRGSVGEPVRVARAPFIAARRGERIGIVGPNGAGKTTLLRTIAGELPPLDGSVSFGSGAQLGYLAQLRAAAIPGATVLDALLEAVPVTAGEGRGYLARFLFRGDDVLKEVRLLSGGERSRLELALLGITASNLLLLDEPTNHLDVVAREAIEAFLVGSPATILVISHDRRFLETICERLWVVDGGLVAAFEGGYRAWRDAVSNGWTVAAAVELERQRLHPETRRTNGRRPAGTGSAAAGSPTSGDATAGSRASRETPAGGRVAETAPEVVLARPRPSTGPRLPKLSKDAYRRQRETIDADLTRLGLRKSHLHLSMGDSAVQANFVELRRITSELADVEMALAAAEDAWLTLEERAP
jgi:ATP-binding cassette subfamily F protein 3